MVKATCNFGTGRMQFPALRALGSGTARKNPASGKQQRHEQRSRDKDHESQAEFSAPVLPRFEIADK
jgi:hypothetical protein